jgi:hypothetical protein
VGEDSYLKTEIDAEGYYSYSDLKSGKYEIKMDLFNLTTSPDYITTGTTAESNLKSVILRPALGPQRPLGELIWL